MRHSTDYSVQCTVYSVQCTVYNVQCTVYIVLCTVYIVKHGTSVLLCRQEICKTCYFRLLGYYLRLHCNIHHYCGHIHCTTLYYNTVKNITNNFTSVQYSVLPITVKVITIIECPLQTVGWTSIPSVYSTVKCSTVP